MPEQREGQIDITRNRLVPLWSLGNLKSEGQQPRPLKKELDGEVLRQNFFILSFVLQALQLIGGYPSV